MLRPFLFFIIGAQRPSPSSNLSDEDVHVAFRNEVS
jgi:hypothetical protein